MALEFVTTDQTATYAVDAGDEVFVTAGTEFRVSDAFDFADFGTMEVYIAGDIYLGDDLLDDSFTNVAALDLFFNFAASSTSLIAGDAFVVTADTSVSSEFHSVNAGNITVGETYLFAKDFDFGSFNNTGTLTGLSTNSQALFSALGLTTDFNFTNSGTVETVGQTNIIALAAREMTVTNLGIMSAGGEYAISLSGSASSDFTINNSGQIRGIIATTGATELSNSGDIFGDVDTGNYEDRISNSGEIFGDVYTDGGADIVTNSGTIHGDLETGAGIDEIENTGIIDGDLDLGNDLNLVLNTGQIFGNIFGGDNSDVYRNGGVLYGSVTMSNGTNTFTMLEGGVVTGRIDGGEGVDNFTGGDADDEMYTYAGNDSLNGRGGDDVLYAGSGNDTILGGGGDDRIYAEEDDDTVNAGDGDDTVNGGTGEDLIHAGAGNDTVDGGDDPDTIFGQDGNDIIDAGLGNDVVHGGAGDDNITANNGTDIIYGEGGDDIITGDKGKDDIRGGAGDDTVDGGVDDDTIRGGNGDDVLNGDAGADDIRGGAGNDELLGENGADILNGRRGNDELTGGAGNDTFVFDYDAGHDIITDFEDGIDLIDMSVFGLSTGADVKDVGVNQGDNYFIDLTGFGGQGSILILNAQESDFTTLDFVF